MDRRGFSRTFVAVEEHIGEGQLLQEADDIVFDELFFGFVIFQVGKCDVGGVAYGRKRAVFECERFISDENAVAVFSVKLFDTGNGLFRIPIFSEQCVSFSVADEQSVVRIGGVGKFCKLLQDFEVVAISGDDVRGQASLKCTAREQVIVVKNALREVVGKFAFAVRFEQRGKRFGFFPAVALFVTFVKSGDCFVAENIL